MTPRSAARLMLGLSDPREIFFELALEDVRRGADNLRAVYELSDGRDGFVSFECTPDLADDAEGDREAGTGSLESSSTCPTC